MRADASRATPSAASEGLSPTSLARAARRVAVVLAFGVAPVALTAGLLGAAIGESYAFDLRQFWQGGRDVLDGVSPYPSPEAVAAAGDLTELDPDGIQEVFRFPYPAVAALAMVPLALLPFAVAAAVMTGVLLLATALSLHVLGVRDWRCYGAAFAAFPVIGAVRLGTLTPLLGLALALAWRYRDRRWPPAAALAAAIVLKLFLWPLLLWLVATRRTGTALLSAGIAALATLAGWAAIGFAGLPDYPSLAADLAHAVQGKGFSLVALGLALGADADVARMAAGGVGVLALAATAWLGRRGGERQAFVASIGAALALTPIVWMHYFALLLVPIAIARPRLSPLWLAPLLFWVTPFQENEGDLWRIIVVAAVAAVTLVAARRQRRDEADAAGLPATSGAG